MSLFDIADGDQLKIDNTTYGELRVAVTARPSNWLLPTVPVPTLPYADVETILAGLNLSSEYSFLFEPEYKIHHRVLSGNFSILFSLGSSGRIGAEKIEIDEHPTLNNGSLSLNWECDMFSGD